MVLSTIKLALCTGRISKEEVESLKSSLTYRAPFDQDIIGKLSKLERMVLTEFETDEISSDLDDEDHREAATVEEDVARLKLQKSERGLDDVAHVACWCCLMIPTDSAQDGVTCQLGHFQCRSCLTDWTRVMNGQRKENSDLWRKRAGCISCKSDNDCASAPYTRADMAMHITDAAVLEEYLAGLESIEILSAQVDYQERLDRAVREARAEIEARYQSNAMSLELPKPAPASASASASASVSVSDSTSTSASSPPSAGASGTPTAQPTRAELEALAESLRMPLPDARMCPNCSFGPIIHRACDDISAHQGEDHGHGARINNACPKCSWFGRSWSDWLPWNGCFSEELNQGAFKLGSASASGSGGSGGDSPPVVLSPEDAKLARLRLLERAAEHNRAVLEAAEAAAAAAAAAKKAASPAGGAAPDLSKLTRGELEEYLVLEERKKLAAKAKEERLKKQKEREMILKQMKADHGR